MNEKKIKLFALRVDDGIYKKLKTFICSGALKELDLSLNLELE